MSYYPLFRVRSWNNGMRCMSLYILLIILSYRAASVDPQHDHVPCALWYFGRCRWDPTLHPTAADRHSLEYLVQHVGGRNGISLAPICARVFWWLYKIFGSTFSIILRHRDYVCNWNPSSGKIGTHLFCRANVSTANVLVRQGMKCVAQGSVDLAEGLASSPYLSQWWPTSGLNELTKEWH